MFDFKNLPFYDNHTHDVSLDADHITPFDLSIQFLHGFRDVPPADENGKLGASEELRYHVSQLGVVKTLVNYMAQKFGCEATLEAVVKARNKKTKGNLKEYIGELYREENIIGTTVDLGWPIGDQRLDAFGVRVFRLFRMDPCYDEVMERASSYDQLKTEYENAIRSAVAEGFIGIKCHVAERFTFAVRTVEDDEARDAFSAAKSGDYRSREAVYFAIFCRTIHLCNELDIPLHIHSGNTGGAGNGMIHNCDPLLMCPFLNDAQYFSTKIMFLHSNYPNIRNAALMAHIYPHVWVDFAWVLPWISLQFKQILREVMGVAPHSKITFGSGQHGIPEIAWMAAKVAKSSLAEILQEYVDSGLLSVGQAQETAEMLLSGNAKRLYKF
jgi:uncharacterized protein